MTKILNLDKIETKRDKVIILGGVEHVMKALTVKDYINQMKASAELNTLALHEDNLEDAERVMDLTIDALVKLFPTITREQFEALTMEQLTAIRELAEHQAEEQLEEAAPEGEEAGKAE